MFVAMLQLKAASLCVYSRCVRHFFIFNVTCSTFSSSQVENKFTVDSLYSLSVDVQKIHKLKRWVLLQSPAYVNETVDFLRDLEADQKTITRILEQHPEAILCDPKQVEAQRELWMTICASKRDLVNIIEKFPASFFITGHLSNQKDNISYLLGLHLNKRIIAKLMASAPQIFNNPVVNSQQIISTLKEIYLRLGGNENNMRIWLQKLLTQNPFILLKPQGVIEENMKFLQEIGFSSTELLCLVSKLRGFITEFSPGSMQDTLAYSQNILQCTEDELRSIVLKCPALLYYSVPILADRFKGLFEAGLSLDQIKDTPAVLELTTQILHYRTQKLRSSRYDIKTCTLEVLTGTKKDFEKSYTSLKLRQERPMFNPVAPLTVDK